MFGGEIWDASLKDVSCRYGTFMDYHWTLNETGEWRTSQGKSIVAS